MALKRINFKAMTAAERLSHFSHRAPSGCLEWIGYRGKGGKGYGLLHYGGKKIGAHVAAYREYVGPVLEQMYVCHKCDNPACIEPMHLFLGTPTDNMRDKIDKGRDVVLKGEDHANSKLTESAVTEIIQSALTLSEIAAKFSICKSTACQIRKGVRWKWLHKKLNHQQPEG